MMTALFAFFSVIYVLVFSYSTSPLYPYYYGNDPAQFLTIGKGWAEGLLPYRDLFDHKGPFIFFVNRLGYELTGNKYGITLIQICFLTLSLLAIYRISQLAENSRIYGFLSVMIALIVLHLNYGTGDSTGEFCLPFICWSFYGILKYYYESGHDTAHIDHDFRWALLYGAATGICFMTRATNVCPIVAGVVVITGCLLWQKRFKNLLANAAAFIAGFLVIVLPFVLYFYSKDTLFEAFYATILYNTEYIDGVPPWFTWAGAKELRAFFRNHFVFYSVFAVSAIRFGKHDRLMGTALLLTGLLEGSVFLRATGFSNYAIVCLPQLSLFLNEAYSLLKSRRTYCHFASMLMLFAVWELCFLSLSGGMASFISYYNSYSVHEEREWEKLFYEIPEEERESFVVYGELGLKEVYLLTDTMPCYKYFIIQDWHGSFSDKVYSEIYETFNNGNAKWILTDEYTVAIDDILESRYDLFDTTDKYKLYRLSDRKDAAWEQELREITGFEEYLVKLKEIEASYDVTSIFTVRDIQGYRLKKEMTDLLSDLGFQHAEELLEHKYHPFIGVSEACESLYEAVGTELEEYEYMKNGETIRIVSACLKFGNVASVSVGGREMAVNSRGINIVVLDHANRLIDTVAFDTHSEEITCTRK